MFFTNSGTESTEAALKLARASTGRFGMLSCFGSFHGKTLGSLSVTAKTELQQLFQPLIPGCEAVPYGDIEALERELLTCKYAAFIVEPIQGEAGVNLPPDGYLKRAEELCRETGTLLVVDEVQTGFGPDGRSVCMRARTGHSRCIDAGEVTRRRDDADRRDALPQRRVGPRVRHGADLFDAHQHLWRRQPAVRCGARGRADDRPRRTLRSLSGTRRANDERAAGLYRALQVRGGGSRQRA